MTKRKKRLLIKLKEPKDFLPLFMLAPTAPLHHYQREDGKHFYFCTTESGDLIFLYESDHEIDPITFPRVFEPKAVQVIDVQDISAVSYKELVKAIKG